VVGDNQKGGKTRAATTPGEGSKESSVVPLEQCSGSAYRWDSEVQRSFRVLGTSHKFHFRAIFEGDTPLAEGEFAWTKWGRAVPWPLGQGALKV